MSLSYKNIYPFTFSVCTFLASRVTRQIKMRRVVEYPFRRRTAVRQRRISAREKVNTVKRRKSACGFPAFLKTDIGESLSFHKCLLPKKLLTPSLFRSVLFQRLV